MANFESFKRTNKFSICISSKIKKAKKDFQDKGIEFKSLPSQIGVPFPN